MPLLSNAFDFLVLQLTCGFLLLCPQPTCVQVPHRTQTPCAGLFRLLHLLLPSHDVWWTHRRLVHNDTRPSSSWLASATTAFVLVQNLSMRSPLRMHPPVVDILVLVHTAMPPLAQTHATMYLECRATYLLSRRACSNRPCSAMPFVSLLLRRERSVHPVLRKRFARAAILLYLVTSSGFIATLRRHRSACNPTCRSASVRSSLVSFSPLFHARSPSRLELKWA